jgi:MFS family permease
MISKKNHIYRQASRTQIPWSRSCLNHFRLALPDAMVKQAQQKQAKHDDQSAAFSGHGEKNADASVEIPRYFYPIFFSMSILALAAAFTTTSVTVSLAVHGLNPFLQGLTSLTPS